MLLALVLFGGVALLKVIKLQKEVRLKQAIKDEDADQELKNNLGRIEEFYKELNYITGQYFTYSLSETLKSNYQLRYKYFDGKKLVRQYNEVNKFLKTNFRTNRN